MTSFPRLPRHEQLMARRRCEHRYQHLHARKGSVKWAKNLGWSRWWRRKIRRQMNRLYKDAHTRGKGGWRKDGRGHRYQLLGGAYTGKLCFTALSISGNKVTGGTPRERLKAAAERAASLDSQGRRRSFYSQSGHWTVRYGITGEPYGYRSDCSQWFISIYWACGLPDPTGNDYRGGYTGTLGTHGRKITREEAKRTPGAAILFGPWPHHHVEMSLGDGTTATIGHGSTHVDRGSFDLLGGSKTYRSYLP